MKTVLCFALIAVALTAEAQQQHSTPQQIFDAMHHSFQPQKAVGLHIRYQFHLGGPQGGDWWIEVHDGKCKIERGKIENPNVTFMASDKDWVALANGKLNGAWATLTGRLKIQGDPGLARKLDEMFP
jgi:putative sterol carrier protein